MLVQGMMKQKYIIKNGDCIEWMRKINQNTIDMILTDPPYGTTACKWDIVIPFDPMWKEIWRVLKPNGACVLFSALSFTGLLISSELERYKYSLVWKKSRVGNFAQAPYRFLSEHEDITVYSRGGCSKNAGIRMTYNPQGLVGCNKIMNSTAIRAHRSSRKKQESYVQTHTGYPKSILEFPSEKAEFHPTQKPVALLEYLIKTYTNEDEYVLDFTMGSGSTGVAAINTNRKFVGIEKDEKYFNIAKQRIEKAIG